MANDIFQAALKGKVKLSIASQPTTSSRAPTTTGGPPVTQAPPPPPPAGGGLAEPRTKTLERNAALATGSPRPALARGLAVPPPSDKRKARVSVSTALGKARTPLPALRKGGKIKENQALVHALAIELKEKQAAGQMINFGRRAARGATFLDPRRVTQNVGPFALKGTNLEHAGKSAGKARDKLIRVAENANTRKSQYPPKQRQRLFDSLNRGGDASPTVRKELSQVTDKAHEVANEAKRAAQTRAKKLKPHKVLNALAPQSMKNPATAYNRAFSRQLHDAATVGRFGSSPAGAGRKVVRQVVEAGKAGAVGVGKRLKNAAGALKRAGGDAAAEVGDNAAAAAVAGKKSMIRKSLPYVTSAGVSLAGGAGALYYLDKNTTPAQRAAAGREVVKDTKPAVDAITRKAKAVKNKVTGVVDNATGEGSGTAFEKAKKKYGPVAGVRDRGS